MTVMQWARLQADQNLKVRRGAWYRIMNVLPGEVVLDVNRRQLAVPRGVVEIAYNRPYRWTIVPRPRDAIRVPDQWGAAYAVCPSCRSRAPVRTGGPSMRCSRCNGLFGIDWDEAYLVTS